MQDIPSVTLDITLAELYKKSSEADSTDRIALVLSAANSEIDLSAHVPRNRKYIYQDSTFSTTPKELSSQNYEKLQRQAAVKYLSLVPQHDAFASGNMPVILFKLDNSDAEEGLSLEEATKTVSILSPTQRPRLLFFDGPTDISLKENDIDILAIKMELDDLERLPVILSLDTHYFLNSKAALCTSGLPTPKCELIKLESVSPDAQSCCSACSANTDSLSVPSNCSGHRRAWLSGQISKMISPISARLLPFVFKNQQTFGGGGTFVISTEDDRSKLIHNLTTRLLPKLLSQVTTLNVHLEPATLLLSEQINEPVGDYGLTFFVTKEGECVFLAVTEQTVDSSKAWIGSKISYGAQDTLRQKFGTIMHDIGAWLHKYGYYGPIGADILETASLDKQGPGDLWITDLNVRTSGSLSLGLLRGHFSERRSLHEASSFSVNVEMGRTDFVAKLSKQFQEGRIIVVSWYTDTKSKISYANVIVGAEDRARLEKEIERVKQFTTEIHF